MKLIKILGLITAVLLINGCSGMTDYQADETDDDTDVTILEKSSLFTESEDEGTQTEYVFETNDTRYIKSTGYTLWTATKTNSSDDFEPFAVKVCKPYGKANAGYGVVFCSQTIDDKPYMLTVMVNNRQQYIVGKVVNGEFVKLTDWIYTSVLVLGAGTYNLIKLDYDTQTNEFIVSLNSIEMKRFTVPENISFKGSKRGYVVVISSSENFPTTPVKVTFEEE